MTLSLALAALPDDTRCSLVVGSGDLTVAELREAIGKPSEFRVLTTGQAAELLGYSGDTWRAWAASGQVHGCYRDDEGGTWRLPMVECERHLARLQSGALHRRRKRGPWPKEGTPPSSARAGSENHEAGTLVFRRSKAVERRQAGVAP